MTTRREMFAAGELKGRTMCLALRVENGMHYRCYERGEHAYHRDRMYGVTWTDDVRDPVRPTRLASAAAQVNRILFPGGAS